ncbi:hypothetical protein F4781DRAFT_391516 [Annulohypoxylon bovei var. microspora]|nr:hypothetical protein F4781DRAFT_391516 [Annulohypoxylon bovei var. microspora]
MMSPYFPFSSGAEWKFRLMVLHPGEWGTRLECHLIERKLHHAPHYQALSYAWGSMNTDGSILVYDEIMKITTNLEIALRRVRQEEVDVVLWVDALV